MTKQWYQEHGFKVSTYIDDAEITRAEKTVRAAYIAPIVGDANVSQSVIEAAVAELAFLYMLQQSVFLTRAGAKSKTGYNSQDADAWARLQQAATSCHLALENLRKQPGANAAAEIVDVCKIYFKTNFISM